MIKITFELYPENGQIRPYEIPYGYVFRAVIMAWLNEIKPELVHLLHAYGEVRPYSINIIIDKRVSKLYFILISYNDKLSKTLIKDLLSNEKVKLKVSQKDYYISKINFEQVSLLEIFEQSKPVNSFSLNFITPVYFNTSLGDYPVRFPIPALIFGNLGKFWDSLSESKSKIDRESFLNWVKAHVYISYYKMRTVKRIIGKPKPVFGGLGNASYIVKKINKNYYKHYLEELNQQYDYEFVNEDYSSNCRWLDILCRLGEYTNVGANRTAGMGVIRYYPKKYISEKDLLIKGI